MPFLEKRSRAFWGASGFILVALVGTVNYFSGVEFNLTLFYLIPIFLVTWFTDNRLGLVISAASVLIWFLTEFFNGLTYSHPGIYVWNTLIRMGFFIITSWLLAELKNALRKNQESARVDFVSGAASVRYFYELAQIEISRFQRNRRPFTLVYIDLDNFKLVNDRLGHTTGDKVLREITDHIHRQIRPADVIGRLGGDEFALLLPETGEEQARQFISRVHSSLVNEMLKKGWVVTFSVGVVTFNHPPTSLDEMVRLADDTMYLVKTNGKNGVQYSVFPG